MVLVLPPANDSVVVGVVRSDLLFGWTAVWALVEHAGGRSYWWPEEEGRVAAGNLYQSRIGVLGEGKTD